MPKLLYEKYKTSSSKEKESASRLARRRWGVEGYSQSQNVSGVRKRGISLQRVTDYINQTF